MSVDKYLKYQIESLPSLVSVDAGGGLSSTGDIQESDDGLPPLPPPMWLPPPYPPRLETITESEDGVTLCCANSGEPEEENEEEEKAESEQEEQEPNEGQTENQI